MHTVNNMDELKEKYIQGIEQIVGMEIANTELADKWLKNWKKGYEEFSKNYRENMLKAAIAHLVRAAYLIVKGKYSEARKHTRKALTILNRYGGD